MTITRKETAEKLIDYLHHKISLEELVDWAETALMDGAFEQADVGALREIVGRIGVADVKAFGLTWADCEDFLARLGYRVSLTVAEESAAYG